MTQFNPDGLAKPAYRPLALRQAVAPWLKPRTAPALIGATIPSASIVWAHAENYSGNAAQYAVQPPTVSRALIDPAIAQPFAILMILGAAFLSVAVFQIARALAASLRALPGTPASSWILLYAMVGLEAMAIAGMVVLSQFVGEDNSFVHDAGSYMLFFGHAFAITGLGVLTSRMLRNPAARGDAHIATLAAHPRHAHWVTGLSFAFGIVYAAGKLAPEAFPFAQHLAFSLLEMVVLLAFLSFLARFHKFLGYGRAAPA